MASKPILALKLLKEGKFEEAHQLVQNDTSVEAARVHALVHRIEGDLGNARYWYRTAGEKVFKGTVEDEIEFLIKSFAE